MTASYTDTVQEKQNRIDGLLREFGPVDTIIAMEEPLCYRHKIHRVTAKDRKGIIHIGNYRAGSHYVIDIDHCRIEDQQSQHIIQSIKKMIGSFRITAYDEDREIGLLRHIMIRKGYATGEIMVILVVTSFSFPGKNNFVRALLAEHPEITTIVLNLNKKHTTMVLGDKNTVLFGPGYIHDRLCGLTFSLSPTAFYQVNPKQTEVLYRTAISYAELTGKEKVIDAYCGTGTIGLAAASSAGQVIGIELNPASIQDAVRNAKDNHIKNARFIHGDAGEQLIRMAEQGTKADVVLMDPPRSGSSEQFLKACVILGPKRIVYISCGPESLRRDLVWLTAHGYKCERITPVDLFPYTDHVETVVRLARG